MTKAGFKIIDAHSHFFDEAGYAEKLLTAMDENGIERSCISGLGPIFGFGTDEDVRAAFESYPDRFIGAVYIRPGADKPEKIERAYEQGFKMIKVTLPKTGYEDNAYFPLWDKAQQYKMPVLFHTGIVACKDIKGEGISSWNMHPLRIDPVTREFPELKVILAHLGVHWNIDAADLARMRPNVYVDLTGTSYGWRSRVDKEGADKYLWWPDAFEKVIFGTDVHFSEIEQILKEDMVRYGCLGIENNVKEKIFSGNIASFLNI